MDSRFRGNDEQKAGCSRFPWSGVGEAMSAWCAERQGERTAHQWCRLAFRHLLALLLLLAVAPVLRAQQPVPGEVGLRLQRLGVEQGLSQASARALAQDGDGMLWIGTQDGLNRYDGYGFRVFRHDPQAADSLSDNHVTALVADAGGRLWVGTQAGGLGRYDPDRQAFHNYPVGSGRNDALASVPVNAMAASADGSLWIASGRGHLQRLNPQGTVFARIDVPADMTVRAVLPLPAGDVLVGGSSGLWRWRKADGRLAPWPASAIQGDIQALARDRGGRIWVGSADRGAFEIDGDGALLRHVDAAGGLVDNDVRSLLVDARGRLWVGTYSGLSRIDRRGAAPRNWGRDSGGDGLASERVHTLLQDRDGLVWIGTWLRGVHLYQPDSEAFREFRAAPGDPRALPDGGVRALAANRDGTLWLGVQEGGGLVHFDPAVGVLDRYHADGEAGHALPKGRLQAIARDPDGNLWLGMVDGGLEVRWRGEAGFQRVPVSAGDLRRPRSNNVQSLYVDRAGTLWVGYEEQGLDALCRGCDRFRTFHHRPGDPRSLPGNAIALVFEDGAGRLWVGARPGGLALLDRRSGQATPLRELLDDPAAASPRTVTMMMQSRRGDLWIGTQGEGVVRLRPTGNGRFALASFTHKQGLIAEAIGSIIEDARGVLWISTTLGISRLEPDSGRIENFSAHSGAQVEGYFVTAGAALPDGRIVFGGLRGLTLFDPERVPPHTIVHRPVITDLRAFQSTAGDAGDWRYRRRGDAPDLLSLRAGSGGFGFNFSALAYADPDQVEYSYRLDPIDHDWTEAGASQRNAGYPHLAPGHYLLRLRARYPGEDYGPERQVDVQLAPLWWQSTWARAGFVLLLLAPFALWGWNRRQRGIERARAQAVLAESEERLKLALWGTGDEFWDADLRAGGTIVRVNPLPHIRTPQDALDFRTLLELAHEDDRAELKAALERHVRHPDIDFECVYRLADQQGEWRWLRTRGRTVKRDASGLPLRMAGVTEDVTVLREHARSLERVNQELELRVEARTADLTRLNKELSTTIDQLRLTQHQLVESEKLAALGSLVAGIAHEVNTPLGVGVTAASHLEQQARMFQRELEAGDLPPQRASAFAQAVDEASAMVLRNLQRADKMIRSFKQVAVDQASEEARLIDVAGYLDEILVSLQPVLKRSPHAVRIEVTPGLRVVTQPGAFYQIVTNLVTNSLLHAFDGIAHGGMRMAAWPEGEGWVFEYSDDGAGMDEEVRRRLYDPFFTTRRGQGGSGLGMHIVYNLATQALGGSIACDSAPGQGTRITLRMPTR